VSLWHQLAIVGACFTVAAIAAWVWVALGACHDDEGDHYQ
jgi:hypothetical protein